MDGTPGPAVYSPQLPQKTHYVQMSQTNRFRQKAVSVPAANQYSAAKQQFSIKFSFKRQERFPHRIAHDNPGPAEYQFEQPATPTRANLSLSQRFRCRVEDYPGAGAYDIPGFCEKYGQGGRFEKWKKK